MPTTGTLLRCVPSVDSFDRYPGAFSLVGVYHFADAADCHLRRQTVAFTNFVVGQVVNRNAPELLSLPRRFADVVSSECSYEPI